MKEQMKQSPTDWIQRQIVIYNMNTSWYIDTISETKTPLQVSFSPGAVEYAYRKSASTGIFWHIVSSDPLSASIPESNSVPLQAYLVERRMEKKIKK